MTHPHDQVCVSPVRIDDDGTIKIFERLYWSEASAKLPGRIVKAIVSPSPYEEIALLSLRGAQLCNAQLLQDTGWADAEAGPLQRLVGLGGLSDLWTTAPSE